MAKFFSIGAAAFALLAFTQSSFAVDRSNAPLQLASYDGKWRGTVNCLYDPGLWPDDECELGFVFDIQGSNFALEQIVKSKKGKETRTHIKPGKFTLRRLGVSALAYSLDTGRDEDGTWVETWSFVMTLLDADHMRVHWTRVVNNVDMPKNANGSKFSSAGMGDFSRVETQ
jgi:hypothetical protein